jgi:hypothetical protein
MAVVLSRLKNAVWDVGSKASAALSTPKTMQTAVGQTISISRYWIFADR